MLTAWLSEGVFIHVPVLPLTLLGHNKPCCVLLSCTRQPDRREHAGTAGGWAEAGQGDPAARFGPGSAAESQPARGSTG